MPKLGGADNDQQYEADNVNKYLKEVNEIEKI